MANAKSESRVKEIKVEDRPSWPEVGSMSLAVQRINAVTPLKPTHAYILQPEEPKSFGVNKVAPFQVQARIYDIATTYVRERTWSEDQTITTSEDGSILLTFTATSPEEVVAWVLGFGECGELLAPEELRAEAGRQIESLALRYKKRL